MRHLLVALLITCSQGIAIAAAAVVPDAGSILQQIQPVTPPAPSRRGPALNIEPGPRSTLPPGVPFPVKAIQISGNTVFDTATLHALVADAEGVSSTLEQLGAYAARITDYYRTHGYPLARAIIPAQTLQSGVLSIEIVEARYGRIGLDNQSRVNDPLLAATLSGLTSGQVIRQQPLDRSLLLLSDIPGVAVDATLKPGEGIGTSDLLVTTAPGPAVSGNVVLDNYGNRYTGRERIGASVNLNNPLRHGDYFSLSALSSGSGLNYGRAAYESLLNGQGTRIGGAYSALHYVLGGSLAPLKAHGTAEVASVWIKHPLLRSRDINLYGQVQYDFLKLRDHVDAGFVRTDRHLSNWTASLSGDARDALGAGALSAWNLGWTSGDLAFDDEAARSADAATARTQGRFSKWNAALSRLQSVGPKDTLYISISGQWTDTNLDSSRKMLAGGPYTVRAYDVGAVSGDAGYAGTLEFRHDLGPIGYGQWQLSAFVDTAHVTVNKKPWAPGTNSASLHGAGVGLNWTGPMHLSARSYVATPIGSTPALVTSRSTRAWIEVALGF